MSTEFGKFIKLLQEAEPLCEWADEHVMDSDLGGGGSAESDTGPDPAPAPEAETPTTAPARIEFDQRKFIPWLANELKAYPGIADRLVEELGIDVSGDVWQVNEIVEIVRNLQPQQHVYIYANMKGQWPAIFTAISEDAMNRLGQLTGEFNKQLDDSGNEVYVIEDQEGVDKYIQIISEMAEWPESQSVREEVEEALTELPYIALIKEALENADRTGKGPWYLRPIPRSWVVSSLKKDKNKQIENTIKAIPTEDQIVEMLKRINRALIGAEYARIDSEKEWMDTVHGGSGSIEDSYAPEGEIIEEIFGWTNKVLDDNQFEKVIQSIEKNPLARRTAVLVVLIVKAAMSHRFGDRVYEKTKDLKALQEAIRATKTGAAGKKRDDEAEAEAEREKERAEHEINQQRIRDKYPGLSDTEIAAKQRQEIDDQRKKLGLDSVQTRFSKFTSLLTSHLANNQKDS